MRIPDKAVLAVTLLAPFASAPAASAECPPLQQEGNGNAGSRTIEVPVLSSSVVTLDYSPDSLGIKENTQRDPANAMVEQLGLAEDPRQTKL